MAQLLEHEPAKDNPAEPQKPEAPARAKGGDKIKLPEDALGRINETLLHAQQTAQERKTPGIPRPGGRMDFHPRTERADHLQPLPRLRTARAGIENNRNGSERGQELEEAADDNA